MKWLLMLPALLSTSVFADSVTLKLSNGLTAKADYQQGKPNHMAVMVVHGFQSTYNYGTIQGIANDLAGKGYTLLTPNLTLGVNQRNEPLACGHPHLSPLDEEGKELAQWVDWLKQQGHHQVIMIGHSAGSASILNSLTHVPANTVNKLILTALYDFDSWPSDIMQRDKKQAQELLISGKTDRYYMGLCSGNYVANSQTYLSYRNWNKSRIIDSINRAAMPVHVIMPEADKRLSGTNAQWLNQLKASKAKVQSVKNADHFFSADAEFDLNDVIEKAINSQ